MSGRTDDPLPGHLPGDPLADVDRAEFLRRHPPGPFLDAVRDRRRGAWPWAVRIAGPLAAVAAVLVVALWGRVPPQDPGGPQPGFGTVGPLRDKGLDPGPGVRGTAAVALEILVQQGDRARAATDGTHLGPGARIRFRYSSPEWDYLMVVSVNEQGEVAPLYPGEPGQSIPVVRGAGIPLPGAVELDGYVGTERFFALFSAAPLDLGQVRAAVEAARRDAGAGPAWLEGLVRLPLDCPQATIRIVKEPIGREVRDG